MPKLFRYKNKDFSTRAAGNVSSHSGRSRGYSATQYTLDNGKRRRITEFKHRGIKITRYSGGETGQWFSVNGGGDKWKTVYTKEDAIEVANRWANERAIKVRSSHKPAASPRKKRTIFTRARKIALFIKRK